ncbi:MAG TPA: hypothetical protein VGD76_11655 [Ramlibacter sp.]
MKIPRILNIVDLATLLRIDPGELLILVTTRPETLPPRLTERGVAYLRWRREDVLDWLLAARLAIG